jgi:shikimate kinase
MYRQEITVKRNFQKLRELPGVRYESVARGFQRVGMSTVEAVNRKISWLFCFSGRVCTLLHISCTLYKKAMNSLHRLHSVYFAAQKLSLSGRGPSILLTQDRFVA